MVFLQSQVFGRHDLPVWFPHIAEMPGLVGNAGDVLFPLGVPQDKPMKDCLFPKFLADSLVGEVWAEKVYRFAPQAQING